jgi:hypothetical protein
MLGSLVFNDSSICVHPVHLRLDSSFLDFYDSLLGIPPFHAVSDEGVENTTRGRVCSPAIFHSNFIKASHLDAEMSA